MVLGGEVVCKSYLQKVVLGGGQMVCKRYLQRMGYEKGV